MPEALVVVDVQKDFCPGGALPVADGDGIVPLVNRLLELAEVRVLTADWHPPDHVSFVVHHPGARPFERRTIGGIEQTLWPVHCVQGSAGARFHPGLRTDLADVILRKGMRAWLDSYSAFFENDKITATGLHGYLQDRGARKLTLVGLATDYCVAYSALDAAKLGYQVTVLEGACRAIDLNGSLAAAMTETRAAGVIWAA